MGHKDIFQRKLANAASLDDALLTMRSEWKDKGVRDLVYGYQVGVNNYVRHDFVIAVTLSDELMEVYASYGGPNADPITENIESMNGPVYIDLREMVKNKKGGKYYGHPYARALLADGYRTLWSFPIMDTEPVGYGVLTAFQDHFINAPKIDVAVFQDAANMFHRVMKENGQLGRYFNLTKKEIETLQYVSMGKAAEDIAMRLGLSIRSIELRLQNSRKKLMAKTTVEAVFKAAAYGILKRQ